MSIFLGACTEENIDSVTEISCSNANGLWTIRGATCDGQAVTGVAPVTYLFDQDKSTVVQTTGRVDCATKMDWAVEVGSQTAIFSMTAQGSLTCTERGVQVDYCSSQVNSCNASIDVTGLKNEFPTCVIKAGEMSLVRTVSAVNNPDNFSYCEDGQKEEVRLLQGEYIPPDPDSDPDFDPDIKQGFLEISGTNPADFGIHPIGSRVNLTLLVSNSGTGPASGIAATGLNAPFLFLGVKYPGAGGTCSNRLEAGDTCTMVIEFFPVSGGYFTDNLLMTYDNGRGSGLINLGLAGTSTQDLALLKISNGPFYDFGSVIPGESRSQQFTISNTGGGEATSLSVEGLSAPFKFTGGLYPGLAGTCGNTLAASPATCTIEVEFNPAEAGPFNDAIEVPYFDGVNSQRATRNIFGVSNP